MLVYDDCSTDNTAEVACSYGAEVISGDENVGCTIGRKRLAEHATSDWIHFHDADDELLPNFVERAQTWMAQGRGWHKRIRRRWSCLDTSIGGKKTIS